MFARSKARSVSSPPATWADVRSRGPQTQGRVGVERGGHGDAEAGHRGHGVGGWLDGPSWTVVNALGGNSQQNYNMARYCYDSDFILEVYAPPPRRLPAHAACRVPSLRSGSLVPFWSGCLLPVMGQFQSDSPQKGCFWFMPEQPSVGITFLTQDPGRWGPMTYLGHVAPGGLARAQAAWCPVGG